MLDSQSFWNEQLLPYVATKDWFVCQFSLVNLLDDSHSQAQQLYHEMEMEEQLSVQTRDSLGYLIFWPTSLLIIYHIYLPISTRGPTVVTQGPSGRDYHYPSVESTNMHFLQATPESCLKYVIMTKTAYVTSFLSSSNSDFNVNRSSFFNEKHGAKLPPITWSDHMKWPCWISKRWSLYPRGLHFKGFERIVVLLNDWGTEVIFGREIKGCIA